MLILSVCLAFLKNPEIYLGQPMLMQLWWLQFNAICNVLKKIEFININETSFSLEQKILSHTWKQDS